VKLVIDQEYDGDVQESRKKASVENLKLGFKREISLPWKVAGKSPDPGDMVTLLGTNSPGAGPRLARNRLVTSPNSKLCAKKIGTAGSRIDNRARE
jgi:hypothetical protein